MQGLVEQWLNCLNPGQDYYYNHTTLLKMVDTQNFCNLADARTQLYPTGGQIHYAALNQRDQVFLEATIGDGVSPVPLLANAIALQKNKVSSPEQKEKPMNYKFNTLSSTGGAKKNLGELALLSATHRNFILPTALVQPILLFLPFTKIGSIMLKSIA